MSLQPLTIENYEKDREVYVRNTPCKWVVYRPMKLKEENYGVLKRLDSETNKALVQFPRKSYWISIDEICIYVDFKPGDQVFSVGPKKGFLGTPGAIGIVLRTDLPEDLILVKDSGSKETFSYARKELRTLLF